MRINQILTESEQEQLQDLYEGPKFNKFGKAVGDIAGMAAKGAGAVAGGVAGTWNAAKKGFQSGKARVARGGDSADAVIDPQKRTRAKAAPMGGGAPVDDPAAGGAAPVDSTTAPAGKKPGFIAGMKQGLSDKKTKAPKGGGAPAAQAAPAGNEPAAPANQLGASPAVDPAPTSAGDINAAGPKGSAPAKAQTGKAALAMQKSADATAGAGAEKVGQTLYAQVKSQVGQLDKKGKQRIMQLLQKSLAQPAPAAAPAQAAPAGKASAPANIPGAKTAPATNAAAPASNAPAAPAQAAPGATTTAPSGEKVIANPVATVGTKRATNIGQPTFDKETGKALPGQALNAIRKKAEYGTGALGKARKGMNARKAPSPSQAEIDADREAKMGVTSDSIIRSHNSLAETLLRAIAKEKSRMVAEGKISIFKAQ
jgi:hypothetical protein